MPCMRVGECAEPPATSTPISGRQSQHHTHITLIPTHTHMGHTQVIVLQPPHTQACTVRTSGLCAYKIGHVSAHSRGHHHVYAYTCIIFAAVCVCVQGNEQLSWGVCFSSLHFGSAQRVTVAHDCWPPCKAVGTRCA